MTQEVDPERVQAIYSRWYEELISRLLLRVQIEKAGTSKKKILAKELKLRRVIYG